MYSAAQIMLQIRRKRRPMKTASLTTLVVVVSVGAGPMLGCSPLTEEGARVVIVDDASAVVDCERIGRVYAESIFGGVMSYVGCQRVRAQMRNAAADKNGTHVAITSIECGVFGGSEGEGEAYRCSAGDTTQQHQPGRCITDTDCGGNRVCTAGKCVAGHL